MTKIRNTVIVLLLAVAAFLTVPNIFGGEKEDGILVALHATWAGMSAGISYEIGNRGSHTTFGQSEGFWHRQVHAQRGDEVILAVVASAYINVTCRITVTGNPPIENSADKRVYCKTLVVQ